MKQKKRISILLALLLTLSLFGCSAAPDAAPTPTDSAAAETDVPAASQDDIVVLYTNDVHCSYEAELGYASAAAMKKDLLETTPHVTLVDCGDAVQGKIIGTFSKGEYIVDMMNLAGYDFAIFGNHEFDFGIPRLAELADHAEYRYLASNLHYSGSGKSPLENIAPYEIVTYDDISVAYIGVTTPETLTNSSPIGFMEDGVLVYDFHGGGDDLYAFVQSQVDSCRSEGADYVVLLTHLGDDPAINPINAADLISATTGVDVVLDGHAHNAIPCRVLSAADGEPVLLSSTGTEFQNIGKLVISANDQLTTTLISAYPGTDSETQALIDSIEAELSDYQNEVIGHTDAEMSRYDADGIRMTRVRETGIGNFCADAYRALSGADVAIVNGGSICAGLDAGDITYADLIAIHPHGNTMCVVEVTGQEILDTLEITSRAVQREYAADGSVIGEEGGFVSISGFRFAVDTSIPTPTNFDENELFLSIEGPRRVTDVEIRNEEGEYVPIDPAATYTLAASSYIIKQGGSNNPTFMDNPLLNDSNIHDYEVLYTYLTEILGGDLGTLYAAPEGRVTIR